MKKIIALLLAVLMVMSLAACGSKQETAANETPAASDGDNDVLLGLIGPMTGDYANYGTSPLRTK